jgi:hypothetical protein
MSIFSAILNKIFPSSHPAATTAAADAPAATPGQTTAAAGAATAEPVDVVAILTEKQAKSPQKLNWQSSIIDMMKLLGLDSSLEARKSLAAELGYIGSTDDTTSMNMWLHKAVMKKLADNGGKVPDDLKD